MIKSILSSKEKVLFSKARELSSSSEPIAPGSSLVTFVISRDFAKICLNHVRENWYIEFTFYKSFTTKYKIEALYATGA